MIHIAKRSTLTNSSAVASCEFHSQTNYWMEIYVQISLISIFYFFSGFKSQFCPILWFYLCRSFKHSNWWRHKLGHTKNI